jgi:serine/threonine-protein kinase RsbW
MAGEPKEEFLFALEIRSDPALLSVVRGAVQQAAELAGLQETECRAVTRAVDEALANIMRHAYKGRRDQPIEIRCQRLAAHGPGKEADALEFLLVDHGRGVDPTSLRGRPLDQVRPGGLGMHFIRENMDEVEYQPRKDCNRLRLVKYLAREKSRSRA